MISEYPGLQQLDESSRKTFPRHSELGLIEYLTSVGRPPSDIGISGHCCAYCTEWIKVANQQVGKRGLRFKRQWLVNRCLGHFCLWQQSNATLSGLEDLAVANKAYSAVKGLVNRIRRRQSSLWR
jgi:hypothetical protein